MRFQWFKVRVQIKSKFQMKIFIFSDPYVEIQLCPKFLYPYTEKQQTTIIKKTLNPQFNEKFEL
jgi:Ca2+-dependent lipid-binding protein